MKSAFAISAFALILSSAAVLSGCNGNGASNVTPNPKETTGTTTTTTTTTTGSTGTSTGSTNTSTESGLNAHCTVASIGLCVDYPGAAYASIADEVRQGCLENQDGGDPGVYESGPCPSSGRVGSCATSSEQAKEIKFSFYASAHNTAEAQQICSNMQGTFTAN